MNSPEKLRSAEQIWKTSVQKKDIEEAIDYATISLPWTFDRMHYGAKTQRSVNERLFHIMTGVLGQSMLEGRLSKLGYSCKMDWTNYRQSDIFDFGIDQRVYDVKTTILYSEYDVQYKRESFTPELVLKHGQYPGPNWRTFFPMMVPMTQISMEKIKDSYIFGIAKTLHDIRKLGGLMRNRDLADPMIRRGFWCSAPFGPASDFLHRRPLIEIREAASKGFFPRISWRRFQERLSDASDKINVTFFGEWAGKPVSPTIALEPGSNETLKQEMSSLSCVNLDRPPLLGESDELVISVRNTLHKKIFKPTDPKKNLNDPKFTWRVRADSFINLRVPNDYEIYWIGHILLREFAKTFVNYPSYFIPSPKNYDVNTLGRYTEGLKKKFQAMDNRRSKSMAKGVDVPWPRFSTLVKGNELKAGILVSASRADGRAIGAACYYYPVNFLESAFYVLPKDLCAMDSLPK